MQKIENFVLNLFSSILNFVRSVKVGGRGLKYITLWETEP
ncbi:hypothetical protein LEP1GSC202_0438 [Leptospira yanagawae serovar Saopaulo str. Sao Paulo = ATCC 700523]|uniref:Uncharacterized protein n=1 Tax=Leptospira yanagawae serovar Saopaulo str. Sao Paulo = ATCC 700523 TaxID=1249483 RepID=A0A5E8HJS7_9LEPT|nr:hypothetical protein LEP1GSC202_0438 [Leptospira yanagawae serovar Saopaulo str. Sao Paulo = ATCC 700523]